MVEIITYSLLAVAGLLALSGGLVAAWRMIPRPPPSNDALEAHQRIDGLEITMAGFADQYELHMVRTNAKLGKLRRALARERGEDEEEEPERAAPSPAPPQLVDKDTLRRRAFGGES